MADDWLLFLALGGQYPDRGGQYQRWAISEVGNTGQRWAIQMGVDNTRVGKYQRWAIPGVGNTRDEQYQKMVV